MEKNRPIKATFFKVIQRFHVKFQDRAFNIQRKVFTKVHADKIVKNNKSQLHKQQLMSARYTYLNSQHVGFNIDENRTHQLLCFCGVGAERKGQTCCWTHARNARTHERLQQTLRCVPAWASVLSKSIMLFQQ